MWKFWFAAISIFVSMFSVTGCKTSNKSSVVKAESESVVVKNSAGSDEQLDANWQLAADADSDSGVGESKCQVGLDCCESKLICPTKSAKSWVSCGIQSTDSKCSAPSDEEVVCSSQESEVRVTCDNRRPLFNGTESRPAEVTPEEVAKASDVHSGNDGLGLLGSTRSELNCPSGSAKSWVACNSTANGCGRTSNAAYCTWNGSVTCYAGCDGYKCGGNYGNCPANLLSGGGSGGGSSSSSGTTSAGRKTYSIDCPSNYSHSRVSCIVDSTWPCRKYNYGVFCEGGGGYCDKNCNGAFKSRAGYSVAAAPSRPSTTTSGTSSGSSSGSGSSSRVTRADIAAKVIQARQKYSVDFDTRTKCYAAGSSAGWSSTMQEYYCEFPINNPNIRECFTASVKGISPYSQRSYADAYKYCYSSGLRGEKPMEWIRSNQDAVFQAVMVDKSF